MKKWWDRNKSFVGFLFAVFVLSAVGHVTIDLYFENIELQEQIEQHEGQMMELHYNLHREQQSLSILIKELGE